MHRPGRNDPCWCGSGKKYKKCHWLLEAARSALPGIAPAVQSKWVKSPDVVERMRRAGAFNGQLMDYIRDYVKPGISTGSIDDLVREYTYDHGHIPACLGYRGFPKSSCTSCNEVVCHGIPSHEEVIVEGDIINVDLTTIVEGCFGDQSETFLVGAVSPEARELTVTAGNAMVEGIRCIRPGENFSRIGEVIQDYVHQCGFSVVVDYTGHGIGERFHEDPPIYHFKNVELRSFLMAPGMTFTVEPMVNLGAYQVELDRSDKWTVRTKDRKLSAQFEHTLLVTETGCDILTLTPSQKEKGVICFLSDHAENRI